MCLSCLSDTKFVYYLYSALKPFMMLKKILNVLWTYSLQDYWRAVWSKTSVDEKAEKTLIEIVKRYPNSKWITDQGEKAINKALN